jgi:hypothetical protein
MKLQDYSCNGCDAVSELLLTANETPTCPECQSTDMTVVLGGRTFSTIVPMYPGSKRWKAGYMHNFKNRPAEKISVSVPSKPKK